MSFIGCNLSGILFLIIPSLCVLFLQFLCAVLLFLTLVVLSVFDSSPPRFPRGEILIERLFLCGQISVSFLLGISAFSIVTWEFSGSLTRRFFAFIRKRRNNFL